MLSEILTIAARWVDADIYGHVNGYSFSTLGRKIVCN